MKQLDPLMEGGEATVKRENLHRFTSSLKAALAELSDSRSAATSNS